MRRDQFLRDRAWQFILRNPICELPVDCDSLAAGLGYAVMSYDDYAAARGWETERVTRRFGGDGFCFFGPRTRRFYIVVSGDRPQFIRRWTLMHEIAHIELGHISGLYPELTRVRSVYRDMLEVEAQGFARRVLCPSVVLYDCGARDTAEIASLCGISPTAAGFRSDYMDVLRARGMFGVSPLERAVREKFAPFVRSYLLKKTWTERTAA